MFPICWLTKLKLSWSELFPVEKVHKLGVDARIEEIRSKYPGVFSGNLGCLKDFMVHIPISKGTQPKSRMVPYALRKRVDEELDALEQQGVRKKQNIQNGQHRLYLC